MENSSEKYYNKLARKYSEVSIQKLAYILSINQIITENAPKSVQNYLDIGCGDGLRTKRIIEMIQPDQATLVDTSAEMMNLARLNVLNATYKCIDPIGIEEEEKFDLITSLWNVIGHFPDFEYKSRFFQKISVLLSEEGCFILDVNNRFNTAHYGITSVLRNYVKDLAYGSASGYFQLQTNDQVKTHVYIHKPNELEKYLADAHLRVINKLYVNYMNGAIEKSPFRGQMVYILKKAQ